MNKIAGFTILWTNNLGEHLTIQGRFLYLFSQIAALKRLGASSKSPLPQEFIEETLETISLLIPLGHTACNRWLDTEIVRRGLDPMLRFRSNASRRKMAYSYWREQLLELSDTFDKAKPQNPVQWWHDRRDMGQWWNYWLLFIGLALAVLFGLIQTVMSVLQVVLQTAEKDRK
ncbi:hypothetical protein VTJ04DRAFT_1795 [Mycothermus thermophilus]|uniref:uncharacterized protein n=1 Tax=Humicola insolens TaxID=85995 RepID=UPI003744901A